MTTGRCRSFSAPRPVAVFVAALAAVVLAVLSVATAPAAAAHNTLTASDPAANAVIPAVPQTFSLTFNDQVKNEFVTVVLTPDGNAPITLIATVSGPTVTATLPTTTTAADPGTSRAYRLGYRVISADDHPISGSIDFTVGTSPLAFAGGVATTPVAAADVSAASDATDASSAGWWVAAGAVVLVVVVAAVTVSRSRRRPPRREPVDAGSTPG